jgi:predicted amidohydrolase
MRLAGAQIPVSKDVEKNVETIKHAIDWATDNECDFLVTPEGSLSGYLPGFNIEETIKGLADIEEYAKEKSMGLCLGTLWLDKEDQGDIRRNQIRFYDKEGVFLGRANKTHGVNHDETFLMNDIDKEGIRIFSLLTPPGGTGQQYLNAVGLICNDMWPHYASKSIPHLAELAGATILIHSSNGARGNDKDKVYNTWHDANLKMISHITRIPIITVDNIYHINGEYYDGPTSSESGVVIDGEWVTDVPRTGTQYFYWDF